MTESANHTADYRPRVKPRAESPFTIEDPLPIPFTNREDEINSILSSTAPAYYLLDAPAGYGKTQLMRQLQKRLREQEARNWLCAYASVDATTSISGVAESLARELGLTFSAGTTPNPRWLGQNWAGALKRQRQDVITRPESGLVLLIDLNKSPSLQLVKILLNDFVPGVEESLRGLTVFAKEHNRFRAVLAGRNLAWREETKSSPLIYQVLQLTPFDYDVIRQTVSKYLPACDEGWVRQLSAHLLHFTGGHPGCMARILELYNRKDCPPPDTFFKAYNEAIWRYIVEPVATSVRSDIKRGLRTTIDTLCTFRYLDYPVLEHFVSKEQTVAKQFRDAAQLADTLTGTYLYSWKGRLLKDDITQRLLAMRIRRRESPNKWSQRCRTVRAICAERLRDPSTKMPEFWAVEHLFQSLHLHARNIDEIASDRSQLRDELFSEHLPETLDLLLGGATGTTKQEERRAFKEALAAKENWQFRFTVNYYLREDQYVETPFQELQTTSLRFFDNA